MDARRHPRRSIIKDTRKNIRLINLIRRRRNSGQENTSSPKKRRALSKSIAQRARKTADVGSAISKAITPTNVLIDKAQRRLTSFNKQRNWVSSPSKNPTKEFKKYSS
uniref:ORF8; putative n=1 Tax=Cauliflower mosaic virus (strain D/H) TaxID=10645 RepID=Q83164_CAMVD|nr:ORF8; putative [Cauliflower mosaic virus]